MNITVGVLFVVLSAFIEGAAHMAFKVAVGRQGRAYVHTMGMGILAFLLSVAFYTGALQRLDVVIAYPVDALSFAFVALFARYGLKERINRRRWCGILLIGLGAAFAIPN